LTYLGVKFNGMIPSSEQHRTEP